MVASAFRAEVALVGQPAGVRDGVVKIGVHSLGGAARRIAGNGACPDQVSQRAARCVAGLRIGVVAMVLGDGPEREIQAAEEPDKVLLP